MYDAQVSSSEVSRENVRDSISNVCDLSLNSQLSESHVWHAGLV